MMQRAGENRGGAFDHVQSVMLYHFPRFPWGFRGYVQSTVDYLKFHGVSLQRSKLGEESPIGVDGRD
jgi:hypothetical protein